MSPEIWTQFLSGRITLVNSSAPFLPGFIYKPWFLQHLRSRTKPNFMNPCGPGGPFGSTGPNGMLYETVYIVYRGTLEPAISVDGAS